MTRSSHHFQRVGHSRCIRCAFETTDSMSFAEQDAAMMAHLKAEHPGWDGDIADVDVTEMVPSASSTLAVIHEMESALRLWHTYKEVGYKAPFDRWLTDFMSVLQSVRRD